MKHEFNKKKVVGRVTHSHSVLVLVACKIREIDSFLALFFTSKRSKQGPLYTEYLASEISFACTLPIAHYPYVLLRNYTPSSGIMTKSTFFLPSRQLIVFDDAIALSQMINGI